MLDDERTHLFPVVYTRTYMLGIGPQVARPGDVDQPATLVAVPIFALKYFYKEAHLEEKT